jgi:hypothetical protein
MRLENDENLLDEELEALEDAAEPDPDADSEDDE